jgi:PKD repeat protein
VTPTAYAWDFGDGTTIGPTPDPGGPYPTLTNAHTYTRPGTFSITMTTYYAAEYSVDNGEFEPITGQTSVTGTPVTVQVLAGGADLVAPTP